MAEDEAERKRRQTRKANHPPSLMLPQTTVSITVSSHKEKETFYVYKDFICYYSPFFRAAFNGVFIEGQTQTMELTNTCPNVFGAFVLWLYSQDLHVYHEKPDLAPNLVQLWVLADLALTPRLQNHIIRVLCGYSREWYPSPKTILTVYARTSPDSPLRKLVIKAYALRSAISEFQTTAVGLYEEMMFDIAVCFKVSLDRHRKLHSTKLLPEDFYVPEDAGL